MANTKPVQPSGDAEKARVVTTAVVRAAEVLHIPGQKLATILGLSPTTISRMKAGLYRLDPAKKEFELGLFLVRLFRGLDSITSGDDQYSRDWLKSPNAGLGDSPLNKIQTIAGMMDVLGYIDAHRAAL